MAIASSIQPVLFGQPLSATMSTTAPTTSRTPATPNGQSRRAALLGRLPSPRTMWVKIGQLFTRDSLRRGPLTRQICRSVASAIRRPEAGDWYPRAIAAPPAGLVGAVASATSASSLAAFRSGRVPASFAASCPASSPRPELMVDLFKRRSGPRPGSIIRQMPYPLTKRPSAHCRYALRPRISAAIGWRAAPALGRYCWDDARV